MATPKLFASTDVNILMTIAGGFNIADIDDITVTLTRNAVTKVFKYSTGEITVSGLDLILTIGSNIITSAGTYAVNVKLLDNNGKIRGITVTPEELTFE